MMFRLNLLRAQLSKHMWPKVTAYAILAVATAVMAWVLKHYIPDSWVHKVGGDTVSSLLTILGSSMLAVTTFSLSTMLSAFSSASSSVTPRATQLVAQDPTTRNVLAAFLGSFLFSLTGLIGLSAGIYEGGGRFVLFIMTLILIGIIVILLIRWIDHLTTLGRTAETTRLVEKVALKAMQKRSLDPYMGCHPVHDVPQEVLDKTTSVDSPCFGYVQNIDTACLQRLARKYDCHIYVMTPIGRFVTPVMPLVRLTIQGNKKLQQGVLKCFVISDVRTYEEDPRFGLCVLAEIASRAISEATRDSGTAIDVLGRLVRVLAAYQPQKELLIRHERVWMPGLVVENLFEDAFGPVSRNGIESYEVNVKLQRCLAALAALDDGAFLHNAQRYSARALERSDASKLLPQEKEHLHTLAGKARRGDLKEGE